MKSRRDITLGEMQDECRKYWNSGNFGYCGKCEYVEVCCRHLRICPAQSNLTDPPRFNEAQMALLKALWNLGVKKVSRESNDQDVLSDSESWVIRLRDLLDLKYETLDLAELLGKDGAE